MGCHSYSAFLPRRFTLLLYSPTGDSAPGASGRSEFCSWTLWCGCNGRGSNYQLLGWETSTLPLSHAASKVFKWSNFYFMVRNINQEISIHGFSLSAKPFKIIVNHCDTFIYGSNRLTHLYTVCNKSFWKWPIKSFILDLLEKNHGKPC